MKTFEEFRFSIPHNKAKLAYKYAPKTYREFSNAIKSEIKLQGDCADLNCIDTSEITDMCAIFSFTDFNGDISNWDTGNVTNMNQMFYHARNFNGDISEWDVSNVKNMDDMFYGAKNFDGDISKWDVSNVKSMHCMFEAAKNFNQDISNWDVSNVKNMSCMFRNTPSFNQDISNWNVSKVEIMHGMFSNCQIKEEYKPKFE